VSTKYRHRQKNRRRQKLGVDENIGAGKMLAQSEKLAQAWRISLLLSSAGSAAAEYSQAQLKVSYFSLMVMLLSVHAVVK
jgi:hypothetical protein